MKLKIGMIATTAGMLVMTCALSARAQSRPLEGKAAGKASPAETREDARLKAIYTAESAWRKAQRGGSDDENDETILPVLPKIDEATQQAKLAHWTNVMQQLDALKVKALSPVENVNYRVFRAQIAVLINDQKFRDYEMPVNSDSAFWSELSDPPVNAFKTADDYSHYLSQLNDTPRFFREEVANMRAGLARRFTPPKVTLEGRDVSIAAIAEAKRAEDTPYWKPFARCRPRYPKAARGA